MKDKKIEEKFNYLLKEVEKKLNFNHNGNNIDSNDRIKINETIDYLENKKTVKCQSEIRELEQHSSNFFKLENLENMHSEKGHNREFEISKKKTS